MSRDGRAVVAANARQCQWNQLDLGLAWPIIVIDTGHTSRCGTIASCVTLPS